MFDPPIKEFVSIAAVWKFPSVELALGAVMPFAHEYSVIYGMKAVMKTPPATTKDVAKTSRNVMRSSFLKNK